MRMEKGVAAFLLPITLTILKQSICTGEIFGGVQVSMDSNDAEVLMESLGKCCSCESHNHAKECSCSGEGLNSVPELLSEIKGPWALIYWQVTLIGKFLHAIF